MTNVLYKIVYEFSFENIFSTLHCLSNKMSKNMLIRGGPLEKWWGGGGGGKAKIKIEKVNKKKKKNSSTKKV
jgi:hypothetical protein